MNVLNLYISVIRICFGFRYSNFVLVLKNFEIYQPKESTKEFVRNFQQILRNKPKFPCFSPKNGDSTKKQIQTNPNEPNFKNTFSTRKNIEIHSNII
jgi:hypothetical protein